MAFSIWIILATAFSFTDATTVCDAVQKFNKGSSTEHFLFETTIHSVVGAQDYKLIYKNATKFYVLIFNGSKIQILSKDSDVNFTGKYLEGDFSFTLSDVNGSKAGKYDFYAASNVPSCSTTLYVLGKPTVPVIERDTVPDIGGELTFRCISFSTTVPENHGIDMNYTWFVGDVKVSSLSWVILTDEEITIKNVQKSDKGNSVTCTATEDVIGGFTSDKSMESLIDVYYGPENMTFIPSDTVYTFHVGQLMNNVTCLAECNPTCTYRWTKEEIDCGEQILSLQNITVAEMGIYTCTATRMSQKDNEYLHLNVIHGPSSSIKLEPNFKRYRKKEAVVLDNITCSAACWPLCDYEWTGPRLQTHEAVLSLGSLNRSEQGSYICTATNRNSSESFSAQVIVEVIYGPDVVSLSPSEASITVVEEAVIRKRNCSAICFPLCTFAWTKPIESSASSTGGILEFSNNIKRADAGNYRCIVVNQENPDHNKSVEFTINVKYGPDKVTLIPSANVYTENVGSVLTNITCTSACNPACIHRWENKFGNSIPATDTLMLDHLTKEERGQYVCAASNPDTNKSASTTVTIYVRFGPDKIDFLPNDSHHSVVEGQHGLNITCSAKCYPSCSQTWVNVSDPGSTLNESEGVLYFGKANRFFTGKYKCKSRNVAIEYQHSLNKSVTITVQYMPDVTIRVEKGQNITFICTATGEPAQYTFGSWVHIAPDKLTTIQIYDGITSGNKNRLVLQALSYMDSGTYRCNVTNMVADIVTGQIYAADEIEFTKTGEPQIISSESRISAAVGSDTKLSTTFYSNDDREPVVLFFKLDNDTRNKMQNDSKRFSFKTSKTVVTVLFYSKKVKVLGYESELTIVNITQEEFGSYEVYITNSVGHNSTTFDVVSEEAPETPREFRVLPASLTSSSVTLAWLSGFYGGANQTFFIEYRRKRSADWLSGPDVFGGKAENKQFSATVRGLHGDTAYEFRIYAVNRFNRSDVTVTDGNTTAVKQNKDPAVSSNVGLIVGGAAGGIVLAAIIVVLVLLFFIRRRDYLSKKSPSKRLLKDNVRSAGSNGTDDTPEINLNPMYESAGPLPPTSNKSDIYSRVDKNRKKARFGGDIYSQVDKPRKRQNACGSVDKNDDYAQVEKKNLKGKDAEKPKHKKQKPDKRVKKEKQTQGDLYDNVDTMNSTVTKGDTVYENPSCSTEDEHPKQMRNQYELIYADLDLPKQSVGKDRKAVIHGLDDKTDYVDIKFGEVGEQAPESDEENTKKDS